MPRPLLLTPGDPQGIGPEITVKFLAHHRGTFSDQAFHVVGSLEALRQAAQQLGIPLPEGEGITYEDVPGTHPGEISYLALERATEAVLQGRASGLVTGPIAKAHLKDAGILAHGHTELLEFFAKRAHPESKPKAEMLFVHRNFRMLLLTRHIPLNRVSQTLLSENLRLPLVTLCQFLRGHLGIAQPRLAVMGVNPHAGEVGGVEEELILRPLMESLQGEGLAHMAGPFAADALFRGFDLNQVPYDAYIAAYHDQGLIPFKLIAGHRAVNVTLGLPFIRTSVGHGTAFDIAGQGLAQEESLLEAVHVAIELVKHSPRYSGVTTLG